MHINVSFTLRTSMKMTIATTVNISVIKLMIPLESRSLREFT